ncbi:hypothetical protein [Arthrobacter zhaoxinii]|uniref:hypothetical protein n=1 Tax=Arthrobacter zhaoxinii TaxID=2964616 RepID=UPI0021070918|nr:hypothetical protein [Arthrobacter zhaoxinii]MCQ2001028.1 hypothetical protein [Arthrobacter zhaoxinii]
MSKAKEIPGIQPSETLVPRVTAPWLAVVLAIASIVGMILASETMDDPKVEGYEDWLMLGIVFLLIVFVVSLVVLIKVGVSATRKLSAAKGRIAESLRWHYGFTVDRQNFDPDGPEQAQAESLRHTGYRSVQAVGQYSD